MITETIFSGETKIIPMADVQHIERHWYSGDKIDKNNYRGIIIITKHTTYNFEHDTWENNIYLNRSEADEFLKCWTQFRAELDGMIADNNKEYERGYDIGYKAGWSDRNMSD